MREDNALRMMSTTGSVVADDAHGSISPVRPSPSLRSVAPASARVGHLIKRAMKFCETNRAAAQCCLRDASTLLGPEPEELAIDAAKENTCRPGGLATWQAERVLDFVEANLGLKMAIEEMADVAVLSMNRYFHRVVGTSPGHWRRMSQYAAH